MLFRKDIEARCAWCAHSAPMTGEVVTCPKKGVVSVGDHCSKFAYDPLKRVPVRAAMPKTAQLSSKDFSLD